jgi:Rod binding domain-containing protein
MNIATIADTKVAGPAQALAPDAALLGRQAKLADAAQKFEGMMLQELLKPMQKAGSVSGGGLTGEDEDPDRDGSLDTFASYGVEAMAEALAKGGGMGLAKQVLRQIGKADEKYRQTSSSTKV